MDSEVCPITPNLELLSDEDLLKKHRQERRELQSKIQSMKKGIPKGDKKKKKEVQDQITQLEQELNDKQNSELSLNSSSIQNCNNISDINIQESESSNENNIENSTNTRISRAKKRREKKEQQDKEREKRIAEQAEANREGPRVIETNTIRESLKNLGLGIHNIPADGNCLYCAVNHQLIMKGKESYTIPKLRKLTAEYMLEHKDEFIPFMYNDSDSEEPVNEEQFEYYCKDVAKTKLWGGQLELRALSHILKSPIKVIQASGVPTLQGENFGGPELILTYHRHLYRLGEHYNSTVSIEQCSDEEIEGSN